ncbi:hypothetical protein BELL_0230g00030 [Botrytis elliptica]|uniref:Uncharacterized protein n=1 Tax=Botrytis elliptica TaxID=278938 RepID=A0A4Z1JNL8_9HELO|nr:hypothetical protein BELL_0230g00030 [Botrytis elliptica]
MRGTWVVAGPALFAARKTLVLRRTSSMRLVSKAPFENPRRAGVYSSLWIIEWRFESCKPITHIILTNAAQVEGGGVAMATISQGEQTHNTQQASGPKGTKIQQPDPAGDNFDMESNPLKDPVNILGRDFRLSKALSYSWTRGSKGAGR